MRLFLYRAGHLLPKISTNEHGKYVVQVRIAVLLSIVTETVAFTGKRTDTTSLI